MTLEMGGEGLKGWLVNDIFMGWAWLWRDSRWLIVACGIWHHAFGCLPARPPFSANTTCLAVGFDFGAIFWESTSSYVQFELAENCLRILNRRQLLYTNSFVMYMIQFKSNRFVEGCSCKIMQKIVIGPRKIILRHRKMPFLLRDIFLGLFVPVISYQFSGSHLMAMPHHEKRIWAPRDACLLFYPDLLSGTFSWAQSDCVPRSSTGLILNCWAVWAN